jgi:hypothetical protein
MNDDAVGVGEMQASLQQRIGAVVSLLLISGLPAGAAFGRLRSARRGKALLHELAGLSAGASVIL